MDWVLSSATSEGQREREPLSTSLLVLSLIITQGSCFVISETKQDDPCPKLEFLSSGVCRPCSLCAPGEPYFDSLVRTSCRQKNQDLQIGGQRPWCDHPHGPFPECSPIPAEVLINCMESCKMYGRRFAPGCECNVYCPSDQQTVFMTCTQDLQWRANSTVPAQCFPSSAALITTTSVTTSTAGGIAGESSVSGMDLQTGTTGMHKERAVTPWNWIILGLVCLVVIIAVIIFGVFYIRYKLKRLSSIQRDSSSTSSPHPSLGDSEKTFGSHKPLLSREETVTSSVFGGATKGGIACEAQPQFLLCKRVEEQEAPEIKVTSPGTEGGEDITPERQRTLEIKVTSPGTGGGEDITPERQALLASAPSSASRESGVDRRTASQQALQALLQDRTALIDMRRLFEQRIEFDRVTWHNLAMEFVEWDADTIRNKEYMLMPQMGCSPGDSFIYQVLQDADQKGKGLMELLQHLQNRQHVRHTAAEDFLNRYWLQWKHKNITVLADPPAC